MLPPTAHRGACLSEQDLASSAWCKHLSSHPVHDLVSRSSQPLTVTAGRKLVSMPVPYPAWETFTLGATPLPALSPIPAWSDL